MAWPVVMQPKEKGGLGVLNLSLQNNALLLKNLDKFYNRKDIPWVQLIWWKYYQDRVPHASREVGSFWWKDTLRLSSLFVELPNIQLEMDPLFCSGMIFGHPESYLKTSLGYSLLLRTTGPQLRKSCKNRIWKIFSSCPFLKMHLMSWNPSNRC